MGNDLIIRFILYSAGMLLNKNDTVCFRCSKLYLLVFTVPTPKEKNGKERREKGRWFLTISCVYGCLQNIDDIRNFRRTKVPIFDLENGTRSGFKELEVSEDCGVVYYAFV